MVVHPPSPEASESEHGGGSTGVPEWQLRDWDDYDFPEDAGGAGGGGSAADAFATMLEGLPGFIAEDIAASRLCCAIFHYLQRVIFQE
jgi:hypothetical protein